MFRLDGAASHGAETELIHLYDFNYKGCRGCEACSLKGGPSYGRCAVADDFTLLFNKISECDALIIGSPVYLGSIPGEVRSFLERLIHPLLNSKDFSSEFGKQISTGLIYTMNVPESKIHEAGLKQQIDSMEMLFKVVFGRAETLLVTDTLMYDDYGKYVYAEKIYNPVEKAKRYREVFPKDCEKAWDMGVRFVKTSSADN